MIVHFLVIDLTGGQLAPVDAKVDVVVG